MERGRAAWPGVLLGLALVTGGCGEGPSPLRLSVELSDDSFCPGGKQVGGEAPETVEVQLGLRARGRAALELKHQPIDLKVYLKDDPTHVVQRKRIHVSMSVGETWRSPPAPIQLPPPADEGAYVLEVSTEDGAWSSTPLEVWYDAQACPRPRASSQPPPPPPSPSASSAPEPETPTTALRAGLKARWRCNAEHGVDDLEVHVQVHNPADAGRAERGYAPRVVGIDELDTLERVAGELHEGYLPPGGTLEFQAFGWVETGARPIALHVSGARSPVATGTLDVDCNAGAGAAGTGIVGHFTPR